MAKPKQQFLILLITLIFFLLAAPFFLARPLSQIFMVTMIVLVLVFAIYEIRYTKRNFIVALILAILTILTHILALFEPLTTLLISRFASLAFLGFVTFQIFQEILVGNKISRDKIYGALCVYILIGITFAQVYSAIEIVQPGSFLINGAEFPDVGHDTRFRLLGFSYSILATVGHSLVQAKGLFAQSVMVIEGLVGILYLSTLVARLVTGFSVQARLPLRKEEL